MDLDMGMGGGGDPHAGMDLGGGMGGGDPHAGMDLGGGDPHGGSLDVTQLGIAPPDPARKIDPSRRVKGTIRVAAGVKGRVKANVPVFVVIRRAGPDGQPTGSALAVEKLTWAGDAIPFELTEANAMSAGTELTGDVIVMARYDQDSDPQKRGAIRSRGRSRTRRCRRSRSGRPRASRSSSCGSRRRRTARCR
jgi:hypothetical protein